MNYEESKGYQKGRKKILLAIDSATIDRLKAVKPDNLSIQECIRQLVERGLNSGEELL